MSGRSIIVFARCRARAVNEMGQPIRATIKNLEEVTHASLKDRKMRKGRSILFIEKALYSWKLVDLRHSKDVAKAARSVDDVLLSRVLSIAEIIPIGLIGAPRSAVGHDRWEELKELFSAQKASYARTKSLAPAISVTGSVGRLDVLLRHLQAVRKPTRSKTNP